MNELLQIILLLHVPYEFAARGTIEAFYFYFHLNVSNEMESGKCSYFQRETKTHSTATAIECR